MLVTVSKIRFSIRDLLWLTLCIGIAFGWWVDRSIQSYNAMQIEELNRERLLSSRQEVDELYKALELSNNDNVKLVIARLGEMPDWTSFSLNQTYPQERALIKQIVEQISQHDLDHIRAAIALLYAQSRHKGSGLNMGKLFVLNKYLFNLPNTVKRDSPAFSAFGGAWLGMPAPTGNPQNPQPSDEWDLRWPWSVNERDNMELTGSFCGFMGPPYDALAAFDVYRKLFGKRSDQVR